MDWQRTIHCIGDLHAGGIKRPRVSAMLDDVKTLGTPAIHLQIGDSTERGLPEEDVLAKRWLGRLPARHYTVLGNHDVLHNKRTAKQWAAAYGNESQSYVIDFPTLRIVAVGPDRDYPAERSGTLSDRTLEWLEARIRNAPDKTCWVACHWPLKHTVMGDSSKLYTSAMQSFHAKPDDRIRALLAKYPNAKAWLSGHTHSPIDAPGLVTRAALPGGRKIVTVNFSAIVGVGKIRDASDPVRSLYLTHFPGRMEVRFRDHGQRSWKQVGGRRVIRVEV